VRYLDRADTQGFGLIVEAGLVSQALAALLRLPEMVC
jgi:hypothetical protein